MKNFIYLQKNDISLSLCHPDIIKKMSRAFRIKPSLRLEVQRKAYENMKETAFQNNGTIFGGFVRDHIISEHYTSLFNEENPAHQDNIDKFWDKTFSPSTRARVLLPRDMDVVFRTMQEANNFIETLRSFAEHKETSVVDVPPNNYGQYSPTIFSIRHVIVDIVIGEIPFVSSGMRICINADVIVPKANITMQPPFNNLDMLCNGFIMTKDGISFSKNTGTIIDHYSTYKKAKVVAGIMDDLVNFKTYLCFTRRNKNPNSLDAINLNIMSFKRIEKMMKKTGVSWSFINLPFNIESCSEADSESENCCICLMEFLRDSKLACSKNKDTKGEEISSAKMHLKCFMQYLRRQMRWDSRNYDDAGRVIFKCPYRNIIDFALCQLDIENAYV